MDETPEFRPGDEVIHPRRPEWGDGVVDQVTKVQHQGRAAQRLVVRFAHHQRVTINTAVAPLIPKESYNAMRSSNNVTSGTSTLEGGWLGALEQDADEHELWRLPESMTDPFSSLTRRLQATLDSFRFSTEPRSLTAWAVAQTGLEDPLTKYTRQVLEQAFPRFARDRNNHLHELVRQIKRQNEHALLHDTLQNIRTEVARKALEKAMRG